MAYIKIYRGQISSPAPTMAINSGGWDACARRTWCNDVYKNAIPSTEKEVFGSTTYANSTAEANNTQFKYSGADGYFCRVSSTGVAGSNGSANNADGLAPFGVI